jgi:hypothetical protein
VERGAVSGDPSKIPWDDACMEMVMECDQPDNPDDGFLPPSATLIEKYCKLYPQWADDFVDFAATCRTMDFWAKKYPAPEPTEAEINEAVRRTMKIFRSAARKAKKEKPTP